MIKQSTVSICREYLRAEIEELNAVICSLSHLLMKASKLPSVRTKKEAETYCRIFNERKRLQIRRKKLENAIRDLKANMEQENIT